MRCGRALAFLGVVVAVALAPVTGPGQAAGAQTSAVRFANPSLNSLEGRGYVQVVVERTDLPVSRLLVHYRTEDGPFAPSAAALAGSDYVHTAGTLVFEVGVRSASFAVIIRDDDVAEQTEQLLLHLETSSGDDASSRMTLLDDDQPSAASAAIAGSVSSPPSPAPARPAPAAAAPTATPEVVVASSAGVSRPAGVRTRSRAVAARPDPPRRIVLQQTPATPFELRPVPGSSSGSGPGTVIDPLLALGAGLLLARVAAEIWFRSRIAEG